MKLECRKIQSNGWVLEVHDVANATGFAELCCSDLKGANSIFEAIHCSKSTKVFRFEWGDRTYYYKEFFFRNLWKYRKIMRRGMHLKHIADLMEEAGFETPRIVCHGRSGLRVFVVSEAAKADESVYDILMEKSDALVPDLSRFRFLFGKEIGRLHSAGFVHGDLRWGNVLVRGAGAEQPSFVYIDNDRTQKYRCVPPRQRIKNLVQIKYPGSLLDHLESDWDAMWEGYVSGNSEVRSDAESWRRRVDMKNARRVASWWKKPRNRRLLEKRKANMEAPHEA